MKYMLLVHHDEDALSAIGEQKLQQMRAESVQLANGSIRKVSMSMRRRCMQRRLGPAFGALRKAVGYRWAFAETREQLGGYF
jgi:hypothetical protein